MRFLIYILMCALWVAPIQAQEATCPVPLSSFAESSVDSLHNRFCSEAQDGWRHENPPADPVQREKDEIFLLLSFALVAAEWDTNRGHQISAIVVDESTDEILWVDLNSNFVNNSPIEHAEARAVRNYVESVNASGTSTPYWDLLDDTAVYASLEPCQMCSGTINMARVDRVVFGMEDPGFGDALDYLHAFPFHADFEFHGTTGTAKALVDEVALNPDSGVTEIIASSRYAFELAVDDLRTFVTAYSENDRALENALAVLESHLSESPRTTDGTR